MAKQEVGRAAQGAGVVDLKQQDVAQLLKKKVVDQDSQQVAEQAPVETAAAEAVVVASADSVFASDASVMVASAGGEGLFGGASTGTIVAVGAAIVGGGFLIAEATKDDDDGTPPTTGSIKVTPGASSVNEGNQIIYTVEGQPGQVFNYTFSGTGILPADYTATPPNSVTIGSDGKAFITVLIADDHIAEGPESLTLTGAGTGVTPVTVTINDTSTPTGQFVNLQSGEDQVAFDGTQVDTVRGVVDPKGATGPDGDDDTTFDVTDIIDGNGHTILELAVDSTGSADVVRVDGVADIQFTAGTSGTVTLDASEWNDIGRISLLRGQDGLAVAVTNLDAGVDLLIGPNVAGAVGASYTTGLGAAIVNTGDGGASLIDGNGTLNVEDGAAGGLFFTSTADAVLGDMTVVAGDTATVTVAASSISNDLTIGDISVVMGDTGLLSITLTSSGNVTAGDIDVTMGDNGSVSAFFSASTDLTMGNVSIAVGDSTGTTTQDVSAFFSGSPGGNVTVGDVSVTAGDDYSVSVYFSNSGTTNAHAGDMIIGDVTVSAGDVSDDYARALLQIQNYDSSGDLTVGDITMSVGDGTTAGTSASLSGTLTLSGESGTDGANVGALTVGNIDLSVGEDSNGYFGIFHSQTASSSGAWGMGDTTVGDINVTLGQDSSLTVTISKDYNGSSGADIGNLTVGDLTAAVDIGATFYYYIFDNNSATSDLNDVTVGSVSINADDGASVSVSFTFVATDGDIGSVSFGDFDFVLGVDASLSFEIGVTGANVSDVTFGDISLHVGQSASADMDNEISISATDGDIGSIVVGDMNIVIDELGFLSDWAFSIDAAGDIGSITFGDMNVDIAASGSWTSYAYVSISADDIGSVTFGDLNIDLAAGTDITFTQAGSISDTVGRWISATSDIGSVSLGDIVVNGHGLTSSVSISVDVDAGADIDSVAVGDVSLVLDDSSTGTIGLLVTVDAGGEIETVNIGNVLLGYTVSETSVAVSFTLDVSAANTDVDNTIAGLTLDFSTTLTTDQYVFNVSVDGDLLIQNVDVDVTNSGSNAALLDFATVVMASVTASGDISLGTVDYSDYVFDDAATTGTNESTGALIDVQTFDGDIVVIGSGENDTIIDNDESNTLTGGAGKDFFTFINTNANVSQATADKVTDFVHNVDHIVLNGGTDATVDEYSEASYASFAAFLTGANNLANAVTSPDYLHAGQVGTSVFVATDSDQDGDVDYVIELQNFSLSQLDFGDFQFT